MPLTRSMASASSSSATAIEQMLASYIPITTEPSLFTGVAPFLAAPIKDYHNPTPAQLRLTDLLLDGLITEDVAKITEAVTKLNLTCHRVDADPSLAIYRCKDISEFPVLLYWRFGDDVEPLVIEDPHNKSDLIFRLATDLILNNTFKARCMISNAASKGADKERAPGQSKRSNADGAHSTKTLFCEIVKRLFRKQGPAVAHLQVHGMVGSANTWMLVENGSGINYTQEYKSFPTEFAYALAEKFTMPTCNKFVLCTQKLPGEKNGIPYTMHDFKQNKAWFRTKSKPINTWVCARVVNGGGTWVVGNDRGVWLGVEFRTASFGMSNNNPQRKNIIEVVALAIEKFKNSTKPSPDINPTLLAQEDLLNSVKPAEVEELIDPESEAEDAADLELTSSSASNLLFSTATRRGTKRSAAASASDSSPNKKYKIS